MPLSLKDLQTPLTVDQVKEVIFPILTQAEFPVEAWQPNGAARSFVESQAGVASQQSQSVAQIAKLAYLPTSETSNDGATGDFMDHLGVSHYDEFRKEATQTVFEVSFINTGGTTHGPLAAGAVTLKAKNGTTSKNVNALTSGAGTVTVHQFIADVAGADSNVPAQILEFITPLAGVTANFSGLYISAGANSETDSKYAERSRSKWGALRVDKAELGFLYLARQAASAVTSVGIDAENPRGPGTADLYLAAFNATAGSADVIAVQAALDLAIFGNGSITKQVLAIAAPTQIVNVAATIYFKGVNDTDLRNGLEAAWRAFLATVPLGGFDFSPGPSHIILTSQIETTLKEVPGVSAVVVTNPTGLGLAIALNAKAIEGTMSFTRVPVNV
jgi:uncharacterized phage protein gp47/JayE